MTVFHAWSSGGEDDSSCLTCGLLVANGYLFREDPVRQIVIGLSVITPDCAPATPSCATHYIGADGTCYHCGIHEPSEATCPGHEVCMYCMDYVEHGDQ